MFFGECSSANVLRQMFFGYGNGRFYYAALLQTHQDTRRNLRHKRRSLLCPIGHNNRRIAPCNRTAKPSRACLPLAHPRAPPAVVVSDRRSPSAMFGFPFECLGCRKPVHNTATQPGNKGQTSTTETRGADFGAAGGRRPVTPNRATSILGPSSKNEKPYAPLTSWRLLLSNGKPNRTALPRAAVLSPVPQSA